MEGPSVKIKKTRPQRQSHVDEIPIQNLIAQMKEFADEFDPSDPAWVEVLIDLRISKMIEDKLITVGKTPHNLQFDDVFAIILGNWLTDDLLELVETFQDLTNSYRGTPSTDDMEDAQEILGQMIQELNRSLQNAKKNNERAATK